MLAPTEPQVEDLGVSGGTTADAAVVAFAAAAVDRRQIFNMHSKATFAAADAAPAGPGGQAVDGGAMAAERAYVEVRVSVWGGEGDAAATRALRRLRCSSSPHQMRHSDCCLSCALSTYQAPL